MELQYKLVYNLVDTCTGVGADVYGPQAKTVNLHEKYHPISNNNDIAIITLEWQVKITPVDLPPAGRKYFYLKKIKYKNCLFPGFVILAFYS
jgi:hypothetical protein